MPCRKADSNHLTQPTPRHQGTKNSIPASYIPLTANLSLATPSHSALDMLGASLPATSSVSQHLKDLKSATSISGASKTLVNAFGLRELDNCKVAMLQLVTDCGLVCHISDPCALL